MRSLGSSHTHSSQHFPGSLTLLGKGQSGLGRRTSMLHRGTQPTAPSRQVHWYLQLLWKDSPLRYTDPPKTQGAPSLAVHTPILRLAGEPKSQKRPLCGSQGSRSVHSSPSCLAQTRQQPQPSSTRLTPAGQRGAASAAH